MDWVITVGDSGCSSMEEDFEGGPSSIFLTGSTTTMSEIHVIKNNNISNKAQSQISQLHHPF